MKRSEKISSEKKKSKWSIFILAILCALAIFAILGALFWHALHRSNEKKEDQEASLIQTEEENLEDTALDPKWETGFIAASRCDASYFDSKGESLGVLARGTQVEYQSTSDGKFQIRLDGEIAYLGDGAEIVSDLKKSIPVHVQFIRSTVNLRDVDGNLLLPLASKGDEVEVIGFDRLLPSGEPHMYKIRFGSEEGYIRPWYLAETSEAALANFDGGSYAVHAAREDVYGGGSGADLDYFPREKGEIEGNPMPKECRALYLVSWRLGALDEYLEIAKNSGINSFVVDIMDGGSIGYASEVMKAYSPSAFHSSQNSIEQYKFAIQKIKDAGFYVIGRITTFNDSNFVKDHPEYAIKDTAGNPMKLAGVYWPSPFQRCAWQYKVDLALEAVELMGFQEIQFDYVRFPDNVRRYEKAGTIDLGNSYGETKAQAIQRFLMYAADRLREAGAYVSADVYGESAYTYVTTYGQYWPAISGVVDVISGMPYPDHFAESTGWRPWEHPYETLNSWGKSVMRRQQETANPAVVRTWIQAYNAIRPPYNTYGPNEISAQVNGLLDAGCTGGYMTWHAASSIDKYRELISAF